MIYDELIYVYGHHPFQKPST